MPKKKILTSEEQELYNELKKLSKQANQRIVRLEREFGVNTWATRSLREKLESEKVQAWTKTGRVAVRKSMDVTQMKATIKATKEFISNPTSRVKGVRQAKAKAIETLKTRFSSDVSEITYEEAEALSLFFNDSDVNKITNFIPGSDILAIIEEERENQKYDYKTFLSKAQSIQQYNRGKSMERILKKIFKKYIFSMAQMKQLIDNANSKYKLDEIEEMIKALANDNVISSKDYTELNNLIYDKKREFEES